MSNADLIFELAQELGPISTHFDRTERIRGWMERHGLLSSIWPRQIVEKEIAHLRAEIEVLTASRDDALKQAAQARTSRHAHEELAKQAFAKWQEQQTALEASYENSTRANRVILESNGRLMEERDALREEVAVLTPCRDHWITSFEHERANVIRLRRLVWKHHNQVKDEVEDGQLCGCPDCHLVRQHAGPGLPGPLTEEPSLGRNPEPPRVWCAMCGKWGDHQSGACPQLTPREPEQPWEVPQP